MNYDDFCKNFGVKLKYYRLFKKFTQEQLAEKLEVDAHYISDIECGRRNITFKTLWKLSKAIGTDTYKFFQFDN
ncbi:helix-turn-helix transcriptional regulator [bacterium]|nr:helix-turn-helix transcriptional regulator [bacterium]